MSEKKVKIESIIIDDNRQRAVDKERVASLMESIKQAGLINPLTITKDNRLVAGYHRREACIGLGWEEVDVRVVTTEGLHTELIEIDENLMRGELTPAQRVKHTKRREEIIDSLGLRAKRGGTGANQHKSRPADSAGLQTTADLAKDVGVSERTYREDVSIGKSIDDDVLDTLAKTKATKEDLKRVAKMKPEQQKEAAEKLQTGKAKSLKQTERETQKQNIAEQHIDKTKHKPPIIHIGCGIEWLAEQDKCDLLLTVPLDSGILTINEFVERWLYAALGRVKDTGFAFQEEDARSHAHT